MNIPILCTSTETAFDSNGLGALTDALECTVTEERNGMFELEMQYPISGIHYGEIALRCLVLAKPNPIDDPQPFRVYRITRPMNGIVTIYAQHISYDLAGIPVQPFTAPNAPAAMQALKQNAVTDCPFTFWTDKQTVATMTSAAPASIRALLGGVRGSVLDVYGGEYAFERYLVRLYNARGMNRGVTIRYGKNLTSLEQDENCASVYTGVYPYWTDADGNLVQLPEKIIAAPGTYNFVRILTLDFSGEWEEAPTEAQLRTRAHRYITDNNVGVPKVSLSVSFVQLEQTEEYKNIALLERVELCDTVNVEFPALGVSASAKVYRTQYDVLRGRWKSVDLGDVRMTLADTIASQGDQTLSEAQKAINASAQNTKSELQKAIEHATQQITGNNGGYVVLHSSTGGEEPDEILVMDAPDIASAKKVWRWNKSGLGYSSRGYNGPYGLAMTQDGQIVADFVTTGTLNAALATIINLNASNINTGTLNANLIKAGILQSANGASRIDMDSGNAKLTGSIESYAQSGTGQTRCYLNANGVFTQNQDGQRRGIWINTSGGITGVFDFLEVVTASQTDTWGDAFFSVGIITGTNNPFFSIKNSKGAYTFFVDENGELRIRSEEIAGGVTIIHYDYFKRRSVEINGQTLQLWCAQ